MRMIVVASVCTFIVLAMFGWRLLDDRADRVEMDRLIALQPVAVATFDQAMVAGLPEPAVRFFTFAIAQGTPLLTVADLHMVGQFSLGDKDTPNYMDIQARQVLAAPDGFVWKMAARSGHLRLSGSDSGGWTRFWLGGVVPVARVGGDPDHARATFARYAAEAVFWTPAAVLPGPHTRWSAVDENTARLTMRHGNLAQTIDVTVDETGQPIKVAFDRWSNANREKTYQMQPFGGYLSDFMQVQGFRVPTHVEAGNFFETDAYFPFYIVDVDDIAFPQHGG